MEPFTTLDAVVVPIDRAHVDTDAIIPKQFMKLIGRTGYGPHLFDEWRYLDIGVPGQDCSARPSNKHFALNQPQYQGAKILLARENFGCGSSREHAAWALHDFGIRALIAPSFGQIFFSNCLKNGMLPVVLDAATVDRLFDAVSARPGARLRIDLSAQTVTTAEGEQLPFVVDPFRKHCLTQGLDEIALTLERLREIRAYEALRRVQEPWLFNQTPI